MDTKMPWTDEKYTQLGETLAMMYAFTGNSSKTIAEHYMIIWDMFTSRYDRPELCKLTEAIEKPAAAMRRARSKSQVDGDLTMDESETCEEDVLTWTKLLFLLLSLITTTLFIWMTI